MDREMDRYRLLVAVDKERDKRHEEKANTKE